MIGSLCTFYCLKLYIAGLLLSQCEMLLSMGKWNSGSMSLAEMTNLHSDWLICEEGSIKITEFDWILILVRLEAIMIGQQSLAGWQYYLMLDNVYKLHIWWKYKLNAKVNVIEHCVEVIRQEVVWTLISFYSLDRQWTGNSSWHSSH